MNNLCTIYSSERIEGRLSELISRKFKNPEIKVSNTSGGQVFKFSKKKGFLKGKITFQISTRFRESIELEVDQSDLAKNLMGIKGFISNIPAPPIGIENLNLLIDTFISETAVLCSEVDSTELYELVEMISKEKNCVLFCQSNNFVGRGNYPHFLNKNLELLLDMNGNSEVYQATGPLIDMSEQEKSIIFPDQIERKKTNIEFISNLGVPTIDHLPFVESEVNAKIRNSEEVASRAVLLAFTNLVAYGNMTGDEVKEIIGAYSLNQYLTPNVLEM